MSILTEPDFTAVSVTRLGNFLKFLARNFITEVSQIFEKFLG